MQIELREYVGMASVLCMDDVVIASTCAPKYYMEVLGMYQCRWREVLSGVVFLVICLLFARFVI